ncbi:MAG: hypothetical protein ACREKM_04200, partial [Longimicrobiales bacterium]
MRSTLCAARRRWRGILPRLVVTPLLLLATALLLQPAPAAAQSRADSAAVILDAARRFELERRGEIAGALYEMILLRYGDTPAAETVRALRRSGQTSLDRSGRTELLVWGTTYGAWLGIALPLILDADGSEAYGLGLLAGAPAGFLAARAYTNDRPITSGQARAVTWGGTWGTWQGFGLVEALDIGEENIAEVCPPGTPQPCFAGEDDFDNTDEVVAGMVVGGVAGIVTGAILAKKPISRGTGATVSLASLWGTAYGASLGYLAGLEDDELLVATLLGGNAALVGSALGQRRWQLSESRARLISIAGVAGVLSGLGLVLLANVDDDDVAVLLPTAMGTAGLIFGTLRTRGMDSGGLDERPDRNPGAGALLEVREGAFDFGTPRIAPRLLHDGNRRVAAVYLP